MNDKNKVADFLCRKLSMFGMEVSSEQVIKWLGEYEEETEETKKRQR